MASFERFWRLSSYLAATLGPSFSGPAQAQAVGAFPPLDTAGKAPASRPPPAPSPTESRYPRVSPSEPSGPPSALSEPARPAAYSGQSQQPAGFFPPMLPYREGAPVPPNYRLEHHPNRGLRTAGATVWALGYVVGLGFALSNDFDEGTGWLAVPVLGPWAALGSREVNCNKKTVNSDCAEEALQEAQSITLITVDGLVQTVGAVLFVVGAASRQSELVRTDVAQVRVLPSSFGAKSAGVIASGIF